MKNYKPACLLVIVILCKTYTYGQVWKQFEDSAKALQAQQKLNEAIVVYCKAIDALKEDSIDTKSYAASCNNLAILYFNTGVYDKALPLFVEAKQIREKLLGNQHPDYAASCNNLATLYMNMGQYYKAAPLYLEAKQLQEKLLGKNNISYASFCYNLALLYEDMGQYEKAEPLYLEAMQLREKLLGKDHPRYAAVCNNLASLYWHMGQYEKAEILCLEAMQIFEKRYGKEHVDYAASCNNLALLYQDIGQYEKAERLFIEARQLQGRLQGTEHPEYSRYCYTLAECYYYTRQYDKAEPLFLEARQIQAKVLGKEHPDYAGTCNRLALLYQDMEQYAKAQPLFLEARQIWKKTLGDKHPYYGSSCENLANYYRLLHRPKLAEKEFKESFSVNAYNLYAVFQFTNEKEKTAYIKNISGEDDKAYSFYISEKIQSGQPYSLSLFHRNLILSSSEALKKKLFYSNDIALGNRYEEWINSKKYLSILYSKPVDKREADVAALEEKAGLQEKELTRTSAAFAKQQRTTDWTDIKSKLKNDEAAIEFVSFHYNNGKRLTDTVMYAALLLRKNFALPVTIFLYNEKQITDVLAGVGNKTTSTSIQKLYSLSAETQRKKNTAASLYDLIWKPLETKLHGIKTVYFAPTALLHRIAFAALPIDKKQVLSDRYKLVQLATTASLVDQKPIYITDTDKIQLYGDISYAADTTEMKDIALAYHNEKVVNRSLPEDLTRGAGWSELPATKKEIAAIVSLSGSNYTNIHSLSRLNATEESLKALDGSASPAVLHIATHGFFFPDPKKNMNEGRPEKGAIFKLSDDPLMRSGLLFAGANYAWQNKPVEGIDDGILSAYEVSNLYLPNTKLVVLSACETGLGEIHGSEGVYGLQRAFKMAGVNNMVMSLWKVSDAEATTFMEIFYKNLFAKQSITEAFYNAQKVMKNKYRLQPYKWAAWVLVS